MLKGSAGSTAVLKILGKALPGVVSEVSGVIPGPQAKTVSVAAGVVDFAVNGDASGLAGMSAEEAVDKVEVSSTKGKIVKAVISKVAGATAAKGMENYQEARLEEREQ